MIPTHLNWLHELPGNPTIVAELKMRSPYGWVNPMSTKDAFDLCCAVGDIVSIHTDALWGGSFDHLNVYACFAHMQGRKVLAKGFHPTIKHVEMAFAAGADYVLTVGWHPDGPIGWSCWHEVETRDQLINSAAPWVVLNARDPRTGKPRTRRDIAAGRVIGSVDRLGRKVCQASLIHGPQDVVVGVEAILIGEGLYTQP